MYFMMKIQHGSRVVGSFFIKGCQNNVGPKSKNIFRNSGLFLNLSKKSVSNSVRPNMELEWPNMTKKWKKNSILTWIPRCLHLRVLAAVMINHDCRWFQLFQPWKVTQWLRSAYHEPALQTGHSPAALRRFLLRMSRSRTRSSIAFLSVSACFRLTSSSRSSAVIWLLRVSLFCSDSIFWSSTVRSLRWIVSRILFRRAVSPFRVLASSSFCWERKVFVHCMSTRWTSTKSPLPL